ncbi:hypothetical protein C4571_02055 [Candidatus Parcubacteria bacterium]|nr:MAG: hypothetical protein C4571_02055 [Candidatus Parcubacteria bacterium]
MIDLKWIKERAEKFEHCQEYDWCKADGIAEDVIDLIAHIEELEKALRTWLPLVDHQYPCEDEPVTGVHSPDGCICGLAQARALVGEEEK